MDESPKNVLLKDYKKLCNYTRYMICMGEYGQKTKITMGTNSQSPKNIVQ